MIKDTLFGIYTRYYFASLYGDSDAVLGILSSERIKNLRRAVDEYNKYEDVVCLFLKKQKAKIERISYQMHNLHLLSLVSISENDGALSIVVAYGDENISKPIYFVKENKQYKLNIFHPFASSKASSRYLILNDHNQEHRVKCRGGSSQVIPAGTSVYMTCDDDCGWIWSGSWFEDEDTGRRVTCDFNTTGWDVRFNESGIIECHDDC